MSNTNNYNNKAPDAINNKYLMQDARLIEFVAD
jgi:hypothetical protein